MPEGIRIHEKIVTTAIRKNNLSGSFVVGKYRCTPYMACQHGCVYCDGRAERYFVEGDFAHDIVVRPNLPELLRTELPKLREKGFISISSGITDAYQPVEAELGITRQCAEVLAEFDSPVIIMTKSALARRDIDLWARIAERSGMLFLVSLTFAHDEQRRIYEPGASPVEQRIETLKLFKEAGCHTGVLAMPLLPRIGDTDENLDALFQQVVEAGADFIMPGGLTLRPGRQKEFFLKALEHSRPDLLAEYRDLYRENRESGSISAGYARELYERSHAFNRRYNIPFLVPHFIYKGKLHTYDEANVLLAHMIELYNARGVDTRPLVRGRDRYMQWLTGRKKVYNRRPSLSYRALDRELRDAAKSPELLDIVGNEKLTTLMQKIILDGQLFDYRSLEVIDKK